MYFYLITCPNAYGYLRVEFNFTDTCYLLNNDLVGYNILPNYRRKQQYPF